MLESDKTDKPARDDEGKLLPGNTANPEGNNGQNKGWQRYGDRAQKLAERYTAQEILEYGRDANKRAEDLSFWDGTIILHMARMMDPTLTKTDSGADHVGKERNAMLDRIEGSPKTIAVLQNPDGSSLNPTMAILTPADGARAYQEMLKRSAEPPAE